MSAALEVAGLAKRYGPVEALRGLDLSAAFGQVTAVLGVNGAGKTTALEICEGFRRPDAGTVRVLDSTEPWRADAEHRARVGVLLQEGGVPPAVRVGEMIGYAAANYRNPHPASQLMEQLGLDKLRSRRFRALSGGERRLTAFACAVVGRPDLLFLDEPTTGLDPGARREVWERVGAIAAAGTAVVLTTHYLAEAEQLADQVVIVHRGRALAAGTPAELLAERLGTGFAGPPGLPLDDLTPRLPAGVRVSADGDRYRVDGPLDPIVVATITQWCAEQGFLPEGLGRPPSLEQVFLELTDSDTR